MFTAIDCPNCGTTVVRKEATPLVARCPKCRFHVFMPPRDITEGTMIGGYSIHGVIGSGAMGHVYAAHQLSMDRDVALKVLHPMMTANSTILRRFVREARIVAKLDHPNIVIAFDAGQDGEFYYLAMARIEGTDLSKLIRERGVPKDAIRDQHLPTGD